jgi:D-3-phosphoglycerate dehydrogenase
MKVLVADQFEHSGLDGLRAAGCEVLHNPALKDEALVSALGQTHAAVLVVRSTKVTAAMMDAGGLALIVRAGAGYNTIDVKAASARGIYVSNCPGKNAVAVAELTLGLILALDRRVPDNVAELRAGRWNKAEYAKARGLHGSTLGLSASATSPRGRPSRAGVRSAHRRLVGASRRRGRGLRDAAWSRAAIPACDAPSRRRWPSGPTS